MTEAERAVVELADQKWPPNGAEEAAEALLPPCPECGGRLEIDVSSCQDPECCGIPNAIRCGRGGCHWEREQYGNLTDLVDAVREKSP